MAGYSRTPLAKKLGFKQGFRATIRHEPQGFAKTLGPLPPGATVVAGARGKLDLVVIFADRRVKLAADVEKWVGRLNPAGMLWVAWPKKSAKVATDLSFGVVQQIGLAVGLVDNKICAIDETWSGLRFVRRLKDR